MDSGRRRQSTRGDTFTIHCLTPTRHPAVHVHDSLPDISTGGHGSQPVSGAQFAFTIHCLTPTRHPAGVIQGSFVMSQETNVRWPGRSFNR